MSRKIVEAMVMMCQYDDSKPTGDIRLVLSVEGTNQVLTALVIPCELDNVRMTMGDLYNEYGSIYHLENDTPSLDFEYIYQTAIAEIDELREAYNLSLIEDKESELTDQAKALFEVMNKQAFETFYEGPFTAYKSGDMTQVQLIELIKSLIKQ